jgi:hypothetical protein
MTSIKPDCDGEYEWWRVAAIRPGRPVIRFTLWL